MKRITLYVTLTTWKTFRAACIRHNISASQTVTKLMRMQLISWAKEDALGDAFEESPSLARHLERPV